MTPDVAALLVLTSLVLLVAPKRWAPFALFAGACYMTRGQAINLGPLTFTSLNVLMVIALGRVFLRREWANEVNSTDGLMLVWAVWMVASVAFHENPAAQVILRLRYMFEGLGLYFLFRTFCRTREEALNSIALLGLMLVPIAGVMTVEKLTGYNVFSVFGGVSAGSAVRDGMIRAQGPFAHSILAGTIGGVCVPLMVGLWPSRRRTAVLGTWACLTIVLTSGSSGPIMSTMAGCGALFLWRYRNNMRAVRWAAFAMYLGLELVMNRPPYFLMASVDLTGSSTGWHRARLIQSALQKLGEWWLIGTDYTRHWMPTGVTWSPNHTDLTNHYIALGVLGGLPLMLLFIVILVKAFWSIGGTIHADIPERSKFPAWAVGSALFAHVVTCLSISYFDQSILFLYFTLALASARFTEGVELRSVAADTVTSKLSKRPAITWQPAATTPGGRRINGRRDLVRPLTHDIR